MALCGGKRARQKAVRSVLGDFRLPSFPRAILGALDLLRRDQASLSKVAESLRYDPGITTRLLKTANSAAHALRRPVTTVPQAAAMLGRANLESLLLSVAVRTALPRPATPQFDLARFWELAGRRAAVARVLAGALHPSTADLSCTAALLQDMAVPLLAAVRPAGYGRILAQGGTEPSALVKLERAEFGCDHAEVAHWLCEEWSFPEHLTAAIAGHHDDLSRAGANDVSVPAAVVLVARLGDGDPTLAADSIVQAAHTYYGLPPDACRLLIEAGLRESESITSALGS
jgi:HD-like signal output (HDOD) protein